MPDTVSRVRHILLLSILALASLGGRALAEDTFLLALSWQPAFCATRAASPECTDAAGRPPRLVLHGLWPDWDVNGDGTRNGADDFCLANPANRRAIESLDAQARNTGNWRVLPAVTLSKATSTDLKNAMPGAEAALDRHEWWKHGTCSGLAADVYFAAAIALMRETERGSLARLIATHAGQTVQRKDLLDAFEQDFGSNAAKALLLDCDRGGGALQEVRIRLKRETVAQGLTAETLAIPAKAPRGDCAGEIRIPDL
jgi:ribonuclease T2